MQTGTYNCKTCNTQVKSHQRFCYNCGSALNLNNANDNLYNNKGLQSAGIFFSFYLVVCLIARFTNLFNAYSRLFWVEVFLALITLYYAYKNLSSLRPILRFNNFSVTRLIGCILFAVITSTIINLFVSAFNISFFGTNSGYYSRYSIYTVPALIMIYSIAVNPAIFEELAFRGVMYNYIEKFLDGRLAVIITSFMFAVVHLNLFSLCWLIPFGIFVGEMRKRYNTIWYGVVFHFTFNLVAVVFDLYRNGYFK